MAVGSKARENAGLRKVSDVGETCLLKKIVNRKRVSSIPPIEKSPNTRWKSIRSCHKKFNLPQYREWFLY